MLNLDNNEIYSIPQLKLLGADNLQQKASRLIAADSQEPLIKDQSSMHSVTGSVTSDSTVDVDELNALALRGTLKPSQGNLYASESLNFTHDMFKENSCLCYNCI